MTVHGVMCEIGAYSPNTLDEAIKYGWLSDVEAHVREILNSYEGNNYEIRALSPDTDADEVLAAPEPYSVLYRYYMLAELNLFYGDTAKYNVFATLYENALEELRLWCVRSFRAKNKNSYIGVV